jgi:Icc-related predicted phosphoesterase
MLVGTDLHNSAEGLNWFARQAGEHRPDLAVCLGDIITGEPMGFLRETLSTLRELAPRSMVIPGNWDPRESLVEMDIAAHDGLVNMHKRTAYHGGYSFAGLGGSATTPIGTTPFETPDEQYAAPLEGLIPADVWVLHNPVYGFRDQPGPEAGNCGSEGLFVFWKRQTPKPLLVLSGHIHEARGTEEAWGTLFVNPGPLADCCAALIRLVGDEVSCELLSGDGG